METESQEYPSESSGKEPQTENPDDYPPVDLSSRSEFPDSSVPIYYQDYYDYDPNEAAYLAFTKERNCSSVELFTNGTVASKEQIYCHFLDQNAYGPNTAYLLNQYIIGDFENHSRRGFDCIKHGYLTHQEGYCDATYDTTYCIRQTKANSTIELPCHQICPYHAKRTHEEPCRAFMSRRCMSDGQWEQQTNYDQCAPYMRPARPEDNPLFDENLIENHRHSDMVGITDHDPFAEVLIHMALWPTLLSMLCLFVAFWLFQIRNLRCTRIHIHQNLIVSWFLYYVFVIMAAHEYYNVNQFISQSAVTNGTTNESLENDQTGFMSKPAVKITQVVLKNFFYLCGSTWFFIEALYLQYQISFGVFGESQLKIKHFVAIGWGIPVIFAVPWIIAIHFSYIKEEEKTSLSFFNSEITSLDYGKFLNSRSIWGNVNNLDEHLIIAVPQWTMLLLTTLFLMNIVRIIYTKIRVTAQGDNEVFKKTLRSTLALLPLFGLGIIFAFYNFDDDQTSLITHTQNFMVILIQNTQGIFIAVIYCFCNKEVQRQVRSRFTRLADRHSTVFYSRATDISRLGDSISEFKRSVLQRTSGPGRSARPSGLSELGRKSNLDNKHESLLSSDVYSNSDSTNI